ncbi:MAG: hypothetical protein ACC631_09880 [Halocynthiibacter sp.]
MVSIWIILVPLSIIAIRFFKPRPTERGVEYKIRVGDLRWWWFHVHKFGLYLPIAMSLVGLTVTLVVSKGFSGSVHSVFGLLTILFGCLQVISSWMRGRHGGRFYATADPDGPSTWHGDHFNMTRRRRLFETYHKTAGYFAMFTAVGAVASGLMQFPMPVLAIGLLLAGLIIFILVVRLEHAGRRYDSYRAVFGYHPENPHNKARKYL